MSDEPERISFRVYPEQRVGEALVKRLVGQETKMAGRPVVIIAAVVGEAGAWIELTVENLTADRIVEAEFAGLRLA